MWFFVDYKKWTTIGIANWLGSCRANIRIFHKNEHWDLPSIAWKRYEDVPHDIGVVSNTIAQSKILHLRKKRTQIRAPTRVMVQH